MSLLAQDQITEHLAQLPGWEIKDGHLTKTYTEMTFAHAMMFLTACGQYADSAGHHPDLSLHNYNKVTIAVTTHDAGGLTDKDFSLAAQIEAIPHKKP